MSIAGGRLDLRVPKQLSNHRQTFANDETSTGEGVAKVVEPHVVEAGRFPNAPPGVLKICM